LSDRAVITEFNLKLAEETEALGLDPALVSVGVERLLKDPRKGLYCVAEVDRAVVGQLMITYEWSDWRNGNIWWLQSVYVAPKFRRRGIFRALFTHITSLARADEEVCGVRLYMHDENAAARKSYIELGMKPTHYQVFEMGFPPRQGP
jgi:GNAT superfamily N-acetyltransferase